MKKPELQNNITAKVVWHKLKRNRPAFISLVIIGICTLVAISAYLFLPDKTPYANNQVLELEIQAPGTSVTVLKVRKNSNPSTCNIWEKIWQGSPSDYYERPIKDYRFKNDKIIFHPLNAPSDQEDSLSLADVIFPLTPGKPDIHLIGNYVQFKDYYGHIKREQVDTLKQVALKNNLISRTYWLGTDQYGRDTLSRFLLGIRISLAIGCLSVALATILGLLLGTIAGISGGRVDNTISLLLKSNSYVPGFLIAILFSFIFGKGFWEVCFSIALGLWTGIAAYTRKQILLNAWEQSYIQEPESSWQKLKRIPGHIIRNSKGALLVIMLNNFATAIFAEAGLSLLGIGVQAPVPSWGNMINDHYNYIVLEATYIVILPCAAILLLVQAFNLLGKGLRDALELEAK